MGILTAMALFCALCVGCAKRATPRDEGTRTGTLILGNQAEPEDLDPHSVTAFTDQNILIALFEGLTAIDEATSQAVPASADHWSVSPDGITWTFHLRAGLAWSNGEPLTAQDFIDSWRRILTPKLGAEYAYLLYPIKNAEAFNKGTLAEASAVGMKAPSPDTIVVTLERPTPYFPSLVAQPSWFPVNPRVLAKFGATEKKGTIWTLAGNLVGNGPFMLRDWSPNARIVVTRNPHYWDQASVHLNSVVFLPTESPDVEEHDFRAGQVHVTFSLPPTKIPVYQAQHPGELRVDPFLQSFFLRFNVTKGALSDARVRRALSMAIDREAIAKAVLQGAFPPARSLTPPHCGPYTPKAAVKTDYYAARELLRDAGYPDGKGLPTFEVQAKNDEVQPKVLEAIQETWKKELGVAITISSMEQKTWVENQQTLNYTISTAGWAGDFLDPVTYLDLFTTEGGNNWTGWGNPRYDTLIEEAAAESDPDKRMEDFQKAEALLLEEAPVAPLYYGARAYLIDPSVHGWPPSILGYHRYSKVSLQAP